MRGRQPYTAGLLLAGLLTMGVSAPTAASPIFADGFEACCSVGGVAGGLDGRSITLRLSAGSIVEDRVINSDGPFRFSSALGSGVGYSVNVITQPASGPPCGVSNAGGTMPAAPVNDVGVNCHASLIWDSGNWGDNWQ